MFRSLSTAVLLLLLALPGVALAQGTGTIAGRVLEADGVTAIIGANVRVGGTTLGAATDIDGDYRIIGVPVGAYDVTASYAGYASSVVTGAEINAGSTRQLNFTLSENTTEEIVVEYVTPLITNDAIGQPRVVTGADLENLPIRGVAATVALQGGIVNTEGSSDLNVRGGRAEEVQYFVDGVRVSGLLGVNQQAIEQQEVLIGTIPARYGDVQSGVISITTKTGADRFFGSAEGVTSTGLDSYGYNLGSLSLGGPVVPGRVGFFLSGELNHNDDNNPYGTATYRLKDDIYDDLQLRPQVLQIRDTANGGALSFIPFTNSLITGPGITRDSLQSILRGNGTLSATQSLVAASPTNRSETFTSDSFELVRGKRDPLDAVTLNGSLNFTFGDIGLRLGGGYATQDRSEYSFTGSLYNRDTYYNSERDNYRVYGTLRQRLTNSAFYQLQGEFSDFQFVRYPNGFSSNIEDVLSYGDIQDSRNVVASRYYRLTGARPGTPGVPAVPNTYSQQFGEDSGPRPSQLTGATFSNAGRTNLTNFQKSHDQRYRFSGSATAQIGVNQIEFGGEYQQDTRRFFSINAFNLASLVNDTATDPTSTPGTITAYDQLDFETLRSLTTRYGYDYLGLNEVDDQDIEAYFTSDALGNRANANLAPYSPVYYAGYIQDKIEFQDLVVQLGLRVDAFDNNTDVLLDLYAPTPILRAGTLTTVPAGIENDYAVYFNGSNSVVGFRDLDGNFYDAQGTRTSSTAIIRDARGQVTSDAAASVSSAFRSYETQVTVMPRVGVSFPVTDRALFFASYNVTSQRPTENAFAPLSSYEELNGQARINNPNLKPERTTQYEIGFRQRLGDRTAVSLSGFYQIGRAHV